MSTERLRYALSGATMGTRWSALLHAPLAIDILALEAALAHAVERVDRQMSTWKPDSDLMRLNTTPPGIRVSLPAELMRVLERGLAIGRASGGAFDIGLGSLINAWGFGAVRSGPDTAAIRASLRDRPPPAHSILELDIAGGMACRHAQSIFDLSGIAKGFAVDAMMQVIEAFGVCDALVSLDGELKAHGFRPDGGAWRVAVEEPAYERRGPLGVIELRDAAIATSGDYRRWLDSGGTRLSHTIDRLRGGPVDNGIASVSVVTGSCMDADAWATALMVLGPTEGEALARRHGLDVLFVQRDGGAFIQIPVGSVFEAAPV